MNSLFDAPLRRDALPWGYGERRAYMMILQSISAPNSVRNIRADRLHGVADAVAVPQSGLTATLYIADLST
jgi:hypothetical protein